MGDRSSRQPDTGKNLTREFSRIDDNYKTLDQVTNDLRNAGLQSSNLIVGIDFTKSNEWTGKESFDGRSLHAINGNISNPYEHAISIIGRTLSPFDDDNLIPCFGFGDVSTQDKNVFSFFPDHHACNGFQEALQRYKELVPRVDLAGPTSFAPIIEAAIDIVVKSDCKYHVLLIIADGQVTRSIDTEWGLLSEQEQRTIDAIIVASEFPLSIVLVGVGDGPWDLMEDFDDNIPERAFDNFQFVNFSKIMSGSMPQQREAEFAMAALMEIPSQYRFCVSLDLLDRHLEREPVMNPLPPPLSRRSSGPSIRDANPSSSSQNGYYDQIPAYEPPSQSNEDLQLCPVCWDKSKNTAFNCGHQTCQSCGDNLQFCPICRVEITIRLRLY